jgi:predicted glycosyltransferase involved in capsule biosynthesis
MKISIVTSYFNRKEILINTLKSIKNTNHRNFEVIIVDDASSEDHRIEDLTQHFPFIKIIRVEPENKWYCNPCVPFNLGFKEAEGEIIIIQNPECFHTSDLISFVEENLKENDYFTFGCYSLNEENTKNLLNSFDYHKNIITKNRGATSNGDDAWYNHPIYRPVGYHFTSAIYKNKLEELNGFDERFAKGYGYDDDEFLHRVKKICNFKILNYPLVLHQHHYNIQTTNGNNIQPQQDNRKLFTALTLTENKIKVNV